MSRHSDESVTEVVQRMRAVQRPRRSRYPTWGAALVFLAFFPYPAVVTLGNTWGLQAAQIVCLLLFVLRIRDVCSTRSMRAFVALIIPIFASYSIMSIVNQITDPDRALRAFVVTLVTLLALPVFGRLFRDRDSDWFVVPVALAMVVNLVVVVYQYFEFRNGVFPFIEYFYNPSFADIQSISNDYALYVARPGGVFPEPSSMSAALGPWGVLLLGRVASGKGRYRGACWAGAIATALAVILSESVYFLALVVAYSLVLLRSRFRGALVVSIVAIVTAGTWGGLVVSSLERPSSGGDASTLYRYEALLSAIELPMEGWVQTVLGYGPGQGVAALANHGGQVSAIYSIILTWWVEGGLVVAVGIVAVILMAWRSVPRHYPRIALLAWFVSVGFTTGYTSLLPLWLFLALVLDGTGWPGAPGHVGAASSRQFGQTGSRMGNA